MKLGFFTMPIHPLAKDWRQSLREDREAFILADELGFTEAYVRRARHRPRREHHLLRDLHRQAGLRDQADQARHRHDQHAEHASGRGRLADRDARSHARRPFHLRHQPRRPAVGRRGVRQSRRQPQRDVPRSHQSGAGDLGERAALQSQGQILEHQRRAPVPARSRPGLTSPSRCSARIRRSSSPRWRRSPRASPKPPRAAGIRSRRTS